MKAITLRSGKELSEPRKGEEKEEESEEKENDEETEDKKEMKNDIPIPPVPVPFPQRLNKQKDEKNFKKFLKIFKELHINIPFVDAVLQVPAYAKFLKELVTKKRRLEEFETIALTEECSAIIQNKLPPKLKDPGSFSIPCTIGNVKFSKALCDLGANVRSRIPNFLN